MNQIPQQTSVRSRGVRTVVIAPWIPGNADTVVVCAKDPPFGTRSDPAEANQTIFTFERKGLAHPTFADSQSSPSEG
jgi:hypothetical protein